MWKFFLSAKNGVPLDACTGLSDKPTLITESLKTTEAHWKSSAITTATTTTVVSVIPNESIMLTDLIIVLSKKVAGATVIVRFSDGTNTVNLFTLDAATAAFQFSHAFQGGIKGWKDANFQVVTDDITTLSVMVGYNPLPTKITKTYSEWNAER